MHHFNIPPFFLFFFFLLCFSSNATVPESETFVFVNEGEFGDYVVEYGANYRVLSLYEFPFQVCFYNTTPGNYTLALRMGTVRSESLMRWVWEANRGAPVGENSTFSLLRDGNLVLAESNGDIVWQTSTANKGVVGFKILPTGNMVLYDSQNKFIWQSFNSPTDTLLVGQSLRAPGAGAGVPSSLISRASRKTNINGKYSVRLDSQNQKLSLYRNNKIIQTLINMKEGIPKYLRFDSDKKSNKLIWVYGVNSQSEEIIVNLSSSNPGFNTSLSYLRLGIDGNLKGFTYDTRTDAGSWKETYVLFPKSGKILTI